MVYMEGEATGTYTHMSNAMTSLYSFIVNPINRIYSDSPSSPTQLFNADGSPNTNPLYYIQNGAVIYNGLTCNYNDSENITLPQLYAYVYNANIIFTKTTEITMETVLYNADYTINTNSNFSIQPDETEDPPYAIQFNGYKMTRDSNLDVQPSIIYAWETIENPSVIWTNSPDSPTALYTASGNLYQGENWSITDGHVYYNNIYEATYDAEYNKTGPFVEVTSYINNINNEKEKFVNSYVGIIGVAKVLLNSKQLQSISLNLAATLGTSPCILSY